MSIFKDLRNDVLFVVARCFGHQHSRDQSIAKADNVQAQHRRGSRQRLLRRRDHFTATFGAFRVVLKIDVSQMENGSHGAVDVDLVLRCQTHVIHGLIALIEILHIVELWIAQGTFGNELNRTQRCHFLHAASSTVPLGLCDAWQDSSRIDQCKSIAYIPD